MRERLDEVEQRLATLKERMSEYWGVRELKRNKIMRTYSYCRCATINGWEKLVVTKYTRSGAEARHAMFPDLDAYNRRWAPVINEMRDLKLEAKALKHAIKAENKAKR